MSNTIKGTVAVTGNVKGNLNVVYGKDGLSAYEIAVKNGFEGTEAEWVESTKGLKKWESGKKYKVGDCVYAYNPSALSNEYETLKILQCFKEHISSGDKPTTNWVWFSNDADTSVCDANLNIIHETYATKVELPSLKKGTSDNSVYLESEKDDTAINVAFTDIPDETVKSTIAGTYDRTTEIGVNATALGTSMAKGKRSLAAGSSNLVDGKSAIGLGTDNYVSGASAIALGYANIAEGEMGVALGSSNYAKGKYAVAINETTKAVGHHSFASGGGTEAKGNYTLSGGYNTKAISGNSVSLGNQTETNGECSLAMGYKTKTNEFCQTVVGRHNDLEGSKNALFVVGSGYDDNGTEIKRNAFKVNMDGTATLYKNPVNSMDVATKSYVDSKAGSGTSSSVDLSNYYTKAEIDEVAQVFVTTDTLESDYYNAVAIDNKIIEINALVKGSIKVWQSATEYKIGDCCVMATMGYEGVSQTVFATCIEDHVSSGMAIEDISDGKWKVDSHVYAYLSIHDGHNNVIHETYATKEELKNYLTEEQVLALIQANMPTSAEGVDY